jgi:hypothetical protein
MTVATLDLRPVAPSDIARSAHGEPNLLRLLGLEVLPASQRRLVCHCHIDGRRRLACRWEPETVLASHDAPDTTAR